MKGTGAKRNVCPVLAWVPGRSSRLPRWSRRLCRVARPRPAAETNSSARRCGYAVIFTSISIEAVCFPSLSDNVDFWHWSHGMRQVLCDGTVSICVSVCFPIGRCKPLRRVCCCGPGGPEISIDRYGRQARRSSTAHSSTGRSAAMRAVSRCQLT